MHSCSQESQNLGDPKISISQAAREFHSSNSKMYSIHIKEDAITEVWPFAPFPQEWGMKDLQKELLDTLGLGCSFGQFWVNVILAKHIAQYLTDAAITG